VPGLILAVLLVMLGLGVQTWWFNWFEKRVRVVVPGQLVRGAYQESGPLRRLIEREGIRTIVTLAPLPLDSKRYRDEAEVVRQTGVRWITLPIYGSRPTLDQMAAAADLLADRQARPIFFHCIAGHHRTSLALAAYRIRHEGWTAERAWREISAVPWARPAADTFDHGQVEAFAAKHGGRQQPAEPARPHS
jgi:protein tyrosine phosphatase (PTP) superfamily phosphohydrolase (DUF442 family)